MNKTAMFKMLGLCICMVLLGLVGYATFIEAAELYCVYFGGNDIYARNLTDLVNRLDALGARLKERPCNVNEVVDTMQAIELLDEEKYVDLYTTDDLKFLLTTWDPEGQRLILIRDDNVKFYRLPTIGEYSGSMRLYVSADGCVTNCAVEYACGGWR